MKRQFAVLVLAAAGASASAFAAPHEVAPPGFAQARLQFVAAAGGNAGASDAAIDAFHALAAAQPEHPLYAAYEGAALALKGRDALMPWDKMKFAEKGANLIEKAVQMLGPEHDEALFNGSPESIEVRLVAANTLLALPDFMNRRSGGKRAVEAALASAAFAQAAAPVKAGIYAAAARVAGAEKRQADEIAWLRKAVAAAPSSHDGARAGARLKELGQ